MSAILAGTLVSTAGQLATNAMNVGYNREQRAWEEHMSNTAYQRAVRDMQMAGLNPALAATKGLSAADTPNVAPPTIDNPAGEAARAGVASAQQDIEKKRLEQQGPLVAAQTDAASAGAQVARQDAANKRIDELVAQLKLGAEPDRIKKQLAQMEADRAKTEQDTKTSRASAAEMAERTRRDKQIADVMEQLTPHILKGGKAVQDLVDYLTKGKPSTAFGDSFFEVKQGLDKLRALPNTVTIGVVDELNKILNQQRKQMDTTKQDFPQFYPGEVKP